VDIDATDGVNINFLTFVGDGVSQIEITRQTPVPVADVVQRSNPVLGNPLTFADGTQQGSAAVGKNRIINGSMLIYQRSAATGITGNVNTYGQCDRWSLTNGNAGGAFSLVLNPTLTDENGIVKPFCSAAATTAVTSITGSNYVIGHKHIIEGWNAYDLIGKPVTLSFTVRASQAGMYSVTLRDGNGSYTCAKTFSIAAPATGQRIVLSFPAIPLAASIPQSSGSGLQIAIGGLNTGTFQAPSNDTWLAGNYVSAAGVLNWAGTTNGSLSITDVQLEAGSVATPFERRLMGHEFALCQRYYETGQQPFFFMSYSGTAIANAYGEVKFKVDKRAAPSVTQSGWKYYSGGTDTACTATLSPYTDRFTFQVTGMANWCGWDGLGTWTANAEL
jgi:hypothetical protein